MSMEKITDQEKSVVDDGIVLSRNTVGLPETVFRAVLRRVISGESVRRAAEAEGVHEDVMVLGLYSRMSQPDIAAQILTANNRRLLLDGAGPATKYLSDVAAGELEADKARTEAVKTLLDRCGLTGAQPQQATPVADMPADQLRAVLEAMEAELARRAKPVDAPITRQSAAEPLGFLD